MNMKNLFLRNGAKRIVLALLTMLLVTAANAIPAKPGQTRLLTLDDGTTVSASLVGDEHGHFWLGSDGRAYQSIDNSEVFKAVDKKDIIEKAQVRRSAANQQRMKRLPAQRSIGNYGNYTGQKKGLIILVNFQDVTFKAANNNALYQRIANEPNFNNYGNFKGSMYDYFLAQSDGDFELTFDVVGPVTVSQNMSHYGANSGQPGADEHPAEMVIEAVNLVNNQVNFANYDWDYDGYVDQVYVVYAGKGEADGGAANTIWPHQYDLYSANYYGDGAGDQYLDGKWIHTYACGSELNGSGSIAGIGTMCHEFSHCLGYPDFYDTDYSGGQGMFQWDLMDSGSYNGNGYRPAGYTSYERWMAGWRTPIELVNTQQISNMQALNNGGDAYIIYNKGNRNEYFLLENRQKTGWDTDIPGSGLLIIHVDYNASVWTANEPNDDPNHQRMTWIPADNEYQSYVYNGTTYYTTEGAANDPFPYGSVNAFGATTTPAAMLYNKNSNNTYYLDSSVEQITRNSNGTISFFFRGENNVAKPTFTPAAGRYTEAQTVSISCETEDAVIHYTIDGTTPTVNSAVYTTPLTISETTTVKAIAVKDDEVSEVAISKYIISNGETETNTFKRVASVDEMVPGMRYIIACGSKATAAGSHNSSYLTKVDVTVNNDYITINDNVAVFVLEQTTNGWAFKNESDNSYLYSTAAKNVAYTSTAKYWTLANGTAGVTMAYSTFGTMLYNAGSPRFTTYTSNPTSSMIQANLYMEDDSSPVTPQPLIESDGSLSFETEAGTPQTKFITVYGEDLTGDITLTLTDQNNVFSLEETTLSPTDSEVDAEVNVTFSPTAAGTYSGTITLSSPGAEDVTVTLTGTATESTTPGDGDRYELVTDATTLAAGDELLIACMKDDKMYVMSTTQNNNNRAATDEVMQNSDDTLTPGESAQVITLEKEGDNFLFNVGDGYLYAASSSANNLRTQIESDENSEATIDIDTDGTATIVFQGDKTRNNIRFNPNNGSPIFSCYASSSTQQKPKLYRKVTGTVEPDKIDVTIGPSGFATLYYSNVSLAVPDDVEAYVYHLENGTFSEIAVGNVISAGTAVVLKDTKANNTESHTYEFLVTDDVTQGIQSNLYGSDVECETSVPDGGSYKYYMLSLNAAHELSSVGFYYGTANGATFMTQPHKAFLALPIQQANGIKALLLDGTVIADTTTGISELSRDAATGNQPLFNLQGQRIGKQTLKGIYVIGGRKVIVK